MHRAARVGLAVGLTLALTSLCLPERLQDMEIWKFDKMADEDQAEYVGLLHG